MLSVKSCWLVVPSIEAVDIYSQPDQHRTFEISDTEIIDNVMNIQIFKKSLIDKKRKPMVKRESLFSQKEMTFRLNANIQVKMVKIKVMIQTILPVK